MKIQENVNCIHNIQKSCLEIVIIIDRICRKHSINYSLCGGSVIGAHLFNGFVPWDDDIDLMMTRENYDKFLKVFYKEAPDRYRLLNYEMLKTAIVPTLFSRIEDMDTEVVEKIAGKVRSGHVFVDITVMDCVRSKFCHKIISLYGGYVYTKLYRHNGMIPGTRWKRILFKLVNPNLKEEKTLRCYRRYEKLCRIANNNNNVYYAELLSAAYSDLLYKREIFDEYTDVVFENYKLMIVKDYIEYLHMRYGDREFTKDMPENQRFNTHIVSFSSKSDNDVNGPKE